MMIGQRILVTAAWSSFRGHRGTITEVRSEDDVRVLLDGERSAMRIESSAFATVVGEASEPNLTGAE